MLSEGSEIVETVMRKYEGFITESGRFMFGAKTSRNDQDDLDVQYFYQSENPENRSRKSAGYILAVYLSHIKVIALDFSCEYMQQLIAKIKGIDAAAACYIEYRDSIRSYKQKHPEEVERSKHYVRLLAARAPNDSLFEGVKKMK